MIGKKAQTVASTFNWPKIALPWSLACSQRQRNVYVYSARALRYYALTRRSRRRRAQRRCSCLYHSTAMLEWIFISICQLSRCGTFKRCGYGLWNLWYKCALRLPKYLKAFALATVARRWQSVNVAGLPAANHFVRSKRVGISKYLMEKWIKCVQVKT